MSHLVVNGNKMNSLGKWKLYNLLSVIDQWRGPRILQFTNRNLPQTRLLDFPSLNKIEFVWNWKVNFQTEFCLVFVQWNGCPDYLLMRVTTCLLDSTKDTCIYCYRDDFTSTKGTILLYPNFRQQIDQGAKSRSKNGLMFITEIYACTIFATMVLSTHGGPIRRTRSTDQMEHRYKNPCGGQRQVTIDVPLLRDNSTEMEVRENFTSEIEPLLQELKQKFADLERKYVSSVWLHHYSHFKGNFSRFV